MTHLQWLSRQRFAQMYDCAFIATVVAVGRTERREKSPERKDMIHTSTMMKESTSVMNFTSH